MPLDLPRFCPILDRTVRPELPLREVAEILRDAGVSLAQLRSKRATAEELHGDARQLISLLPSACSLIVNDRVDVAVLAGAAGVHLGQEDLPVPSARKLLGDGKIIGLSAHNGEQVEAAQALPADYIAVGPIFATTTKMDTEPVIGLEGLRSLRGRTTKPLMAIGGVTVANAAAVIEAGADSVAVISAWLTAEDISARLEEFRHALGRLD